MGGYRLPVTPYAPQQNDPLETVGRLAQLQGLSQQRQLGAEQLKGAQLSNQSAQMDFDDQQKWRKAFMDAQGDPEKTLDLASKAGVSPKSVLGYKTTLLEQRQKLATLSKDQLANAKAQAELIGNHAQAALSAPPEQRPQAVQASLTDLVQQGVMDQQTAQQSFAQYQQQGDDWLKLHATAAMSSKDQIDAQIAKQKRAEDAAAAAAKLPGEIADSKQKQLVLAGTNAQGVTAAQQGEQKIGRARLAMESRKIQLDYLNAGFTSDGQPMNAASASPTARQIAAGKMDPATARAMLRKQPGLYNQVLAVDPSFDEASIDKRFSFNKELTNYGQSHIGGQALALNKLVHHSDLLYDLVDGLDNGNFRPGNQLFNSVKTTFGNAPMPRFQAVRDFVVGEATKLAHGGVPNESDVKRAIDNMSSSNSPEQLKGAINEYLALSGGQMQAINEQGRQSGMGEGFTILGPEAKSIVQKHGIDPTTLKEAGAKGGITVTDPRGVIHSFPNQAAADNFKKLANIQ